jgi:putative methanogenesis marker 16 metalloprotein
MVRSFRDIADRLERKEAVVLTAQEVCELVESGHRDELAKVDVVTAATRAVMSGTYAVFSFPFAAPGSFVRAKSVWINGVPAHVGPCPNENLGFLDLVVFGTARSRDDRSYGGGHLFRDLVEGKAVLVEVETDVGKDLHSHIWLDEMPYTQLFGSRHAFKNYAAFVNPGPEPLSTIFHAIGFDPRYSGATFSGCGQINPVKNDPNLEAVGVGTRILMNGAEGFVIGTGTRSTPEKPNLAGFADMHFMKAEYMGGFLTSAGPECICSWALPIPVTSPSIMEAMAKSDRDITLPINDVTTRQPIGQTNYGEVWCGANLELEFAPEKCLKCAECQVQASCPTGAINYEEELLWDDKKCFHCGMCTTLCKGGVFRSNLGAITLGNRKIPVVLRQSDRARALQLAEELKERILDGSFKLTQAVEKIA